jgi:Dolichyl-phosphate-mannose-protein mannosyltransferase
MRSISTELLSVGQPQKTRYIHSVREFVRQNFRYFLLATLAALALRLFFILYFPGVTTDSFVYGDIAKNWLQHGIYGLSGTAEISPTYIRLPGYPAFLALIFAIFGMEHYRAVLVTQMFVDVGSCFVIADMARRVVSPRAAKAVFWLAAPCPFLANYSAAALTETLEVFFTVLALDFAIVGLDELDLKRVTPWLGCGLTIAGAILLRPDGGLLVISIEIYLIYLILRARPILPLLRAGITIAVVSLAPLIPWTLRNLHTMRRFEPLAPRYANEEEEYVPMGFNHWVKTWIVDYGSVEEIYWPVPGAAIDPAKLPGRAFDSQEQKKRTLQFISDYNQALHIDPNLDARFEALARTRIRAAPLRYYAWLPLLRIADMWLRPRTEMLPADSRWWEFDDDLKWSVVAVGFGAIGVAYVLAALAGLVRGRAIRHLGLLVTFVAIRSLFLGTLENPEPRYTLECYPVLLLLVSVLTLREGSDLMSNLSKTYI